LENLILTGNIVLPLFLLIAAGFALRRAGIVGESLSDGLNLLVFELFLPAMIFETIYETEVGGVFDAGLLGFSAVFTLAVTGLSMWIVPKLEPDDRKRGTLVQAIFRSNVVIFGLPLVNAILGEGNSGPTALLIAFMIPLFNILSVMVFAYYGGGKTDFRSFLRSCLKNPLMIACALGLLFLAAGWRLPDLLAQGVRSVSSASSTISLVALGTSIEFRKMPGNIKQLAIGLLGRLAVAPALGIAAAALCGFRGASMVPLLAMLCTPTSVSSFAMAKNMGADGELAGELVVTSMVFSLFSIFFAVYLSISLGLIE